MAKFQKFMRTFLSASGQSKSGVINNRSQKQAYFFVMPQNQAK